MSSLTVFRKDRRISGPENYAARNPFKKATGRIDALRGTLREMNLDW
jgi:hypothetical protein